MTSFARSDRFNNGMIVRQGIDTDSLVVNGSNVTSGGPTGPTGPSGGPTGPTGSAGVTGPTGSANASGSQPATASSTGTAGTIAYDANFLYVCVATDTWKRVAITTW